MDTDNHLSYEDDEFQERRIIGNIAATSEILSRERHDTAHHVSSRVVANRTGVERHVVAHTLHEEPDDIGDFRRARCAVATLGQIVVDIKNNQRTHSGTVRALTVIG